MAVITVVGSGMMGSALAFPAAENGHEVRLAGTPLDREIIDTCRRTGRHPKLDRDFPAGCSFFQVEELETALAGADLVIGGISSFGVEWFSGYVLPKIPAGTRVLTVTKGLADTPEGELLPYPYLWKKKLEELGKELDLCAVGGPCTSYELVAHDHTEVVFCGYSMEALQAVRELLATEYYHIRLTTDVLGTESAVALKNGYALAVALTIGANRKKYGPDSPLHFNSQAGVFGQAAGEMYGLLQSQGVSGMESLWTGIGDLYVTVYGGRTRQIGILLGQGEDIDRAKEELNGVTLESLVVAERVARAVRIRAAKGLLDPADFPLLFHVDAILHHAPADIPWEAFTH